MRDLGERVRLIHELRELRGAEELPHRGHDWLGVDEIVRHGRRHLLVDAHLFLDGALHADETDAELVLEQLTHRTDAPVTEVVDVVDVADVLREPEQVLDDREEIARLEQALIERALEPSLVLSFSRPTREKSYFWRLKNMPWKRLRELSSVGGSPGRSRR